MDRQKRFRLKIRIGISFAFGLVFLLNAGIAYAEQPGDPQTQSTAPSAAAGSLSQPNHPLLQNPLCFGDYAVYDGTNYTGVCWFYWGTGFSWSDGATDKVESVTIRAGWSIRLFKEDDIHGPQICINANDPNLWDNYFSDGSVVANNASLVQVLDTPDCPPPSQPNLLPYTPGGWSYPLVPSSTPGTTVVYTLYASLDTYLNFAYQNAGTYGTTSSFSTCLYSDGIELYCESNSLAPNATDLNADWQFPAWQPTQGWHTLKIVTDVGNVIGESNEADNVWERSFYWGGDAPFTKLGPGNDTNDVPLNPILSWSGIDGATSYEYCYDTISNTSCDSSWISAGLNTNVSLSNLFTNTTYFWQVRAVNGSGTAYPDDGAWFKFKTQIILPGAFSKLTPANNGPRVALNPTLTWTSSSLATRYEYCNNGNNIIKNTCYGSWVDAGLNTSFVLTGLLNNRDVYWQVRAVNASGVTYANNGEDWWHFTTEFAQPGAFSKTGPANGATGVSTSPTLTWTSSSDAYMYYYCINTSDYCFPNTAIYSAGTSINLSGLSYGTTYYWQVRGVSSGGSVYADNAMYAFSSFTTIPSPPGAFAKTGPADGAASELISPTLRWQAAGLATEYQYCYDASDDDACSTWLSSGTNTSVELSGLAAATPYFWQVRATHSTSEPTYANGSPSAFWSFTTAPTPPPLILIPGLGGTRLGNDQGELWLGLEKMVDDACSLSHGLRATNEYLDVLQLNSSGTAPLVPGDPHYASVAAGGVLDTVQYAVECVLNREGDFLVYQPLIDYLETQGYQPE